MRRFFFLLGGNIFFHLAWVGEPGMTWMGELYIVLDSKGWRECESL